MSASPFAMASALCCTCSAPFLTSSARFSSGALPHAAKLVHTSTPLVSVTNARDRIISSRGALAGIVYRGAALQGGSSFRIQRMTTSDTLRSDALVFFGATGDLAYKKIFPALQAIAHRGKLDFPVIGVAKSGWALPQLLERARASVTEYGGADEPAVAPPPPRPRSRRRDPKRPPPFAPPQNGPGGPKPPRHFPPTPPRPV